MWAEFFKKCCNTSTALASKTGSACRDLDKKEKEKLEKDKEDKRRKERRNRDAFKALLQQHRKEGRLYAKLRWKVGVLCNDLPMPFRLTAGLLSHQGRPCLLSHLNMPTWPQAWQAAHTFATALHCHIAVKSASTAWLL